MGWLLNIFTGDLLGKVVDGVAGHFRARARARESAAAVEAKVRLAKVNHDAKVELADHEIQVLRTKGQGASWKDEYVTILVSLPVIVAGLGAVLSVFAPEAGGRLVAASETMAGVMTGDAIDYSELWLIVVTVALGTKPFRRR